MAYAAWELSQSPSLNVRAATDAQKSTEQKSDTPGLDAVSIIPEFAAQVTGYVKSPQRTDGLHLLVDIGAGTLDITTFNVHRPVGGEEDRFPIFLGKVRPLGTHVLMAMRLSSAGCPDTAWADTAGIPSAEDLASQLEVEPRAILDLDTRFTQEVCNEVTGALNGTRIRRYPLASEWERGLRVFIAGGGSESAVYRNGIECAFRRIRTPMRATSFPALLNVGRDIDEKHFHRLSVAYGLTFDAELIGKIVPAQEIEDAPLRRKKRRQPDRDELYPK